jgi:hypothetical protein
MKEARRQPFIERAKAKLGQDEPVGRARLCPATAGMLVGNSAIEALG